MAVTVLKTAGSIVLCPTVLQDDINNDVSIVPVCESVTIDNEIFITFIFSVALSPAEDTQLDVLIDELDCSTGSIGPIEEEGGLIILNDGMVLASDTGRLNFEGMVAATADGNSQSSIFVGVMEIENNSGSIITQLSPVIITGVNSSTNELYIEPADASDPTKMPAFGVLLGDVAVGDSGMVVVNGACRNLNTTGFAVDDEIYVAPGGGITTTKPIGANLIQKIAQITKIDAIDGRAIIFGAGRSNDLPNLVQNFVWVGDANGVPQAQLLDSGLLSDWNITGINVGDTMVWDGTEFVPGTGGGGSVGSVLSFSFFEEEETSNKWLNHTEDESSNEVPAVIPYDCELSSITYSNHNAGTDTDIQIWRAAEGAANSDSKILTWSLVNARTARKNSFSPAVTFSAGDKVAVYLKDTGVNPNAPMIILHMKITAVNSGTNIENYSAHF